MKKATLIVSNTDTATLSVGNTDKAGFTVHESVSPYAAMMEALKAYIDSLMVNVGNVVFCEGLPDEGEAQTLYVDTTTASAYIWLDSKWVILAGGEVPLYTGETTVIPKVAEEQTLETKDTRLDDNVTVTKIPVSAVDNEQDGKTVTIG